MERKEFIKGLKLIAIYQHFNSLQNYESLLTSGKVPLAKFKDDENFKSSMFQEPEEIKQQVSEIFHASEVNMQSSSSDVVHSLRNFMSLGRIVS